LVVSGGGFQGLTLLKGLRESGSVRIIVADSYEQNVGRYFANRAYTVPPIAETDAFVGALLEICREEGVRQPTTSSRPSPKRRPSSSASA